MVVLNKYVLFYSFLYLHKLSYVRIYIFKLVVQLSNIFFIHVVFLCLYYVYTVSVDYIVGTYKWESNYVRVPQSTRRTITYRIAMFTITTFRTFKFVRVCSLVGRYFHSVHIVNSLTIVLSLNINCDTIFPCWHNNRLFFN